MNGLKGLQSALDLRTFSLYLGRPVSLALLLEALYHAVQFSSF